LPHYLTLYGTPACHLCDQAEELLVACLPPGTYHLVKVDVAEDDDLLGKYGLLIPVLELEGLVGGLHWPFDRKKLLDFLTVPE
jgi:hypothetical protein